MKESKGAHYSDNVPGHVRNVVVIRLCFTRTPVPPQISFSKSSSTWAANDSLRFTRNEKKVMTKVTDSPLSLNKAVELTNIYLPILLTDVRGKRMGFGKKGASKLFLLRHILWGYAFYMHLITMKQVLKLSPFYR